jgi:hypothetical protein
VQWLAASDASRARVAEWRAQMAAFLNGSPWDWWVTLTFRREDKDGKPLFLYLDAVPLATEWLNGLYRVHARGLTVAQCRREPVQVFMVSEGEGEAMHLHLVLANAATWNPAVMQSRWRHGRALVEAFDARRDAVSYLLKELSPASDAESFAPRWRMTAPLPARVRHRLRGAHGRPRAAVESQQS